MSFTAAVRRARHAATVTAAAALISGGLAAVAVPGYAVTPKTPKFSTTIENLSPYQPQTTCAPIARPGVIKFRALVLATYKGTGDDGIVRNCKIGGRSEHKEGRAWDWQVSVKNAHQVAQVHALFNWLFATDAYGHKYAMARRLGVMYIIWDKKIWGAYASGSGWRPYSCSGVTGCHQDHVHFSFNWPGANGKTSYWTKVTVNVGGTPGNGGGNGNGGSGGGKGGSGGATGGTTGGPTRGPTGGDGDGLHPPPVTAPTLPETVDVAVDGRHVATTQRLEAGHHYLVTVSGSYTYATVQSSWDDADGQPLLADAECTQQPQWSRAGLSLAWSPTPAYGGDWRERLLDLSVDGATVWTPATDDGSGCDQTDHRYVMSVTPDRDGPLDLHVVGGARTGATGSLTVTVSTAGS